MAMTKTANRIEVFGELVLTDVKSIPARLRHRALATLTAFSGFYSRKVCEEKSLFFRLLFMPITMAEAVSLKIKAHRKGLSLDAFLKLETAELEAETKLLDHLICQERIKNMEWLTRVKPGATVNDYEMFVERRPFWSLMFLRGIFWKWVFGISDKEGG